MFNKLSRPLSKDMGLSNMLAKYQMMGQPAPVIEDDEREFEVILPLLQPEAALFVGSFTTK